MGGFNQSALSEKLSDFENQWQWQTWGDNVGQIWSAEGNLEDILGNIRETWWDTFSRTTDRYWDTEEKSSCFSSNMVSLDQINITNECEYFRSITNSARNAKWTSASAWWLNIQGTSIAMPYKALWNPTITQSFFCMFILELCSNILPP